MADTYSFGVILSELATCIKPFDGVTNALIVLKVTSEWKRKIAMQSWNTIFNAVVEQTSCSTSGAKLVAVSGYKTSGAIAALAGNTEGFCCDSDSRACGGDVRGAGDM
ncbi:hypothetical protein JG687_00019354 [Phytophthora cactorum]|uniref:Uncharacterized protein n=1 Tax=Phytophthora cactorum TaxID=29920 RepID=A0A8T1TMB7_9STRA|nr:hypothetical protein JG687_00019354 [Phytophthora cactorum]